MMSGARPGARVAPTVHPALAAMAARARMDREDPQMTDDASRYPSPSRSETSGWRVVFAVLAAIMMLMVGAWRALAGLTAILENEFYVTPRNYIFQLDATTWGWI